MNGESQQLSFPVLRMLCTALLVGQLVFAAIVGYLMHGGGIEVSGVPYLGAIAGATALLFVPIAFVVRGKRFAVAAAQDGSRRMQTYGNGVIVFFALLEGAGLFNLVAWLVTGEWVPSVPVFALLWAIAAASFPSEAQLENLGR